VTSPNARPVCTLQSAAAAAANQHRPTDSARPPAWSRKASRSTPISAQSENQHQTHRHLPVSMLSCIGALVTTGSHSSSPTSSSRSLQPRGPQAMAGPYTHTVRAHGGSIELLLRARPLMSQPGTKLRRSHA